jgi:GNAT superfamily N-acetyltransferase
MSAWTIERLAAPHDRTHFDCGKPPLSQWLREQAGQFERKSLARTYVAVREGQTAVLGYYALSACQVSFEELPSRRSRKLPRRMAMPAILLGRLAVDRTVQGLGLGNALLVDALRRVEGTAEEIGVLAVVVDAIDEEARRFYLSRGFENLVAGPIRRLFLPVETVRAMGLGPLSG